MPTRETVQYTIRGVSPEIDAALRKKARQRRISLNQLLLEELAGATGTGLTVRHRSLSALAGRWQEDPEFDKVLEEQRVIDSELWR